MNEPLIASVVGEERTVGAFVNFGADYLAPGRIFVGGRGALYVGELDGRPSERVDRLLADLADAHATPNILGFLWAKEAYGAMLFATAVSDLSIVDALAEPRYRGVFVTLAREVLAAAPVPVEPFDGFDADDLDGSVDRLVEFNRRSAKTHSGIYRDLMVRKRKTEKAMLEDIDGPLLARTLELIGEIEEGRRTCEVANLELLAAYQRLQERGAGPERRDRRAAARRAGGGRTAARSRRGCQGQHRRRGRRDDERVDGRDAAARGAGCAGRRAPAGRGRRSPVQDEPARVRRRQRQRRLRHDVQPARPDAHGGRLEQRLGGARRRGRLRLRPRHRHRRLDPHPGRLLRHRRPEADATAWCRSTASSRSRRRCDHVGTLTATVRADGDPARRALRPAGRAAAGRRRCASACCGARSTTRT